MKRISAIAMVLLVVGCADDPVLTPSVPTTITRVGSEVGTPGWLLTDGLSVVVRDHRGEPLEGVTVEWSSAEGGTWFGAASSVTDIDGVATVAFAPGWRVGDQQVRVTVGALLQDVIVKSSSMVFTEAAIIGGRNGCGLDGDGTLWCWSAMSALTRAHPPVSLLNAGSRPFVVDAGTKYRDLVLIGLPGPLAEHCGLTVSMQVRCWYYDGSATVQVRSVETPVPFVSLTASEWYSSICGLDATGQAWCRGANAHGQLGDDTRVERTEFAPVAGAQRFKRLATQGSAFCGIDADDLTWCWGTVGQQRPVFLIPTRMAGAVPMRQVSFSYGSPCGIGVLDHQLYCWWGGQMEGVPATGTDAVVVPTRAGLLEMAGNGALGVFRWTDGRLGFTGDMAHEPGLVAFLRRPTDLSAESNNLFPPLPGGFESILTKGGDSWCGAHQGGATLCAYGVRRLLGVPAPQ